MHATRSVEINNILHYTGRILCNQGIEGARTPGDVCFDLSKAGVGWAYFLSTSPWACIRGWGGHIIGVQGQGVIYGGGVGIFSEYKAKGLYTGMGWAYSRGLIFRYKDLLGEEWIYSPPPPPLYTRAPGGGGGYFRRFMVIQRI